MDLNGARRKNATRETTSTLKAWLNEHRKNPYPTKGEKIMLAIITRMTLTQVCSLFTITSRVSKNAKFTLRLKQSFMTGPKGKLSQLEVAHTTPQVEIFDPKL